MEFPSIAVLCSFVLVLCVKMCDFSITLIAFEIAAVRLSCEDWCELFPRDRGRWFRGESCLLVRRLY